MSCSSTLRAHLPPLALIAGPTASGKSDCAINLALALEKQGKKAVIINADSSQIYRDLAILSARPTTQDMRGIRHVLFGIWDGARACSAAEWASLARAKVRDAHDQGIIPILTGGTGLYIRTLLDGIAPVPQIIPKIRDDVRKMALPDAYEALRREDPDRAAKLHANDRLRIFRALEVVRSTGKTLAEWQGVAPTGGIASDVQLFPLVLFPDRTALYARCEARFQAMLDNGAIEEVKTLLSRNLSPSLPVMRAIGVTEIGAFLEGQASLRDITDKAVQATRNYAKRQYTWLRHQLPPQWLRIEPERVNIESQFEILLQ